jgi:glycosyltransferase involved in cell wall biosynthesis
MPVRAPASAPVTQPPDACPLKVLLVTESTYPYNWGGLSTWCHALVRELSGVEFSMLAVTADPFAKPLFALPPNVVEFTTIPLWGIRESWEVNLRDGGRRRRRRRRLTSEVVVEECFAPHYRTLIRQVLGGARDDVALAEALHAISRFSREHDFDEAFRSRAAWSALCEEVDTLFPALADGLGYMATRPAMSDLAAASQWFYHWLFPLSQPIPKVDVAHATMAGICSMISVVCKLEHGSGFLLSEHGIYLREVYLAEHASSNSLFRKCLKVGFARRMTELAYAYADLVAPCCDYNQRWERRIGVEPDRIRTAYYGIDSALFEPVERVVADRPVVVWAGRIDPLKDVETLLLAAAIVKEQRPEVRFLLYGGVPVGNEEYNERCLSLHLELGLQDTVSFEGFTSDIGAAFAAADLVVLSSISEGFPFSTLEAMLCGKPIVATAVGGMAEQVTADCGRVVRPRSPQELGAAILDVLGSPESCRALARGARERAASHFSIERFRETHQSIYDFVLEARKAPRPVGAWQTASAPSTAAAAPIHGLEHAGDEGFATVVAEAGALAS